MRSAFNVWRLAFGVRRRRSAFGGCGAREALAQEGEAPG